MACGQTKCRNCPTHAPACQLKEGLCSSCYSAQLQTKSKENAKSKTN